MKHAIALACGALVGGTLVGGAALAGAVTDGSMGAVQSLQGAFTVPQSLGTVRGANLFHSFTRFGIASGESATFTTSDTGLRFVIARVTGTEASLMQGPLALQAAAGSRPDFVLLNPNGIVVAAGARFDLPAGLHLSTAQQLRFADGTRWDSGSTAASTLTVAAPESFGFLGPAAALRWSDAPAVLAGRLALSAGSVTVERSQLATLDAGMELHSQGRLTVSGGAELNAVTRGDATPGALRLRAAELLIDGGGLATGIGSYTLGAGAAALLQIEVSGHTQLTAGGQLYSATFADGASGALELRSGSLAMDSAGLFTFVGTQSIGASGAGSALRVQVQGAVDLAGASLLTTQASGSGAAGPLSLSAASLAIDGQGLDGVKGLYTQGGGGLQVDVAGGLRLAGSATIGSSSHARLPAAPVQVRAGQLRVEGGPAGASQIASISSTRVASADVLVQARESLRLGPGGQIVTASLGDADAGSVAVSAPTLTLAGAGSGAVTTISSSAFGSNSGNAGKVAVSAGTLQMSGGASITTEALAVQGHAGRIELQADHIGIAGSGDSTTSVRSIAYGDAGNAGTVVVDARQRLELRDGGSVTAGALGAGSPGEIVVRTPQLQIDGAGNTVYFTGIAGDILTSQGAGAAVRIDAGRVELRDGGSISTSTYTAADAGSIRLRADSLRVDGSGSGSATGISAISSGGGRAGALDIEAREVLLTDDALLSTATLGSGPGGRLTLAAQQLTVQRSAGIVTATGGSGDAGDLRLQVAGTLALRDGGVISANTAGAGAAGQLGIEAGSLQTGGVDPRNGLGTVIASRARAESSGQPGSIVIGVRDTLDLGPSTVVTVSNAATVANPSALRPGQLTLRAGQARLQGAEVSAAASGNADAGALRLEVAGPLRLDGSTLRTSARDGNGGPITVAALGTVQLRDSAITTSVDGERNGNGGDVNVRAPALVLQSGFVQANTRAPRSRGGDVRIDVGLLLPDGGSATIGGNRIVEPRRGVPGLNAVQAAAPDGVSGTLDVTVPQLDLSGSLAALFAVPIDFGPLGADLCRIGDESSLTPMGRGALPAPAAAPLRWPPR